MRPAPPGALAHGFTTVPLPRLVPRRDGKTNPLLGVPALIFPDLGDTIHRSRKLDGADCFTRGAPDTAPPA